MIWVIDRPGHWEEVAETTSQPVLDQEAGGALKVALIGYVGLSALAQAAPILATLNQGGPLTSLLGGKLLK